MKSVALTSKAKTYHITRTTAMFLVIAIYSNPESKDIHYHFLIFHEGHSIVLDDKVYCQDTVSVIYS